MILPVPLQVALLEG